MTWRPHQGQQEKFLSRGETEVLFGGAAGPGKTDCLIMGALRYVGNPNYKGLLLRRTFPRLQEIIDRCWQHYPKLGGVYRAGEHRWYFPSGASITLGHCQHEDNKYDYQGKEYHYIGFDELTQFTYTQYMYIAFSRARSTDPSLPVRIRATTNPGGIGHHWVKERFIDRLEPEKPYIDPETGTSRLFVPATIEDNPTLYENDPAYVRRLELLPEVERDRLRYGIWDSFEGQVFTELTKGIHGCDPFEVPPEWEKFMVFDWGYSKPFCAHWYAMDYDGVLYLYREWYGCKEGEADVGLRLRADEVARGILERETEKIRVRIADPSIWHPRPSTRRAESRGPTIHEDFIAAGIFFIKADNDRLQGKQQVHRRFRVDDEIDTDTGEIIGRHPQFQAFNNCTHFWRTVPFLTESPKNPEDVDTDQEDHAYDCTRYMCMARPVKPKKQDKIPRGSFVYEREKMIRARQHARKTGMSVTDAYRTIR